jgi:hypothetical protein
MNRCCLLLPGKRPRETSIGAVREIEGGNQRCGISRAYVKPGALKPKSRIGPLNTQVLRYFSDIRINDNLNIWKYVSFPRDEAQRLRDREVRDMEDLSWKVIGIGNLGGPKETNVLRQRQVFGEVCIWHLEGGTYWVGRRVQTVESNQL